MTTLTLKINERSKFGQAILDLISVGQSQKNTVEIVKVPNANTLKSMEEARLGKVITASNATELLKKLKA